MRKPIALTGDRPTGALHIGHYSGSLRNRVSMQDTHDLFVLIADMQAMTDHAHKADHVKSCVMEVMLDYLAVGIDPDKVTICLQSRLPALSELTNFYLNFVSVGRLERNPTVRDEIRSKGMESSIPAGFLAYPVAQAADITAFLATDIPVGEDQLPIIEQTNEIVSRVNSALGINTLQECRAILSSTGRRLPGPDGKTKMSKSRGNILPLSSTPDQISAFVKSMYTDSGHLRIEDPGKIEGNAVFMYLDAFDHMKDEVERLKEHYQRGGLGDGTVKKRLNDILQEVIRPIRERRSELEKNMDYVRSVLRNGTDKANLVTQDTKNKIFEAAFY